MKDFNPDPKPDSKKIPRTSKAWRKRVDELYERDNYECQGCQPKRWLKRNEAVPHHMHTFGSTGNDDLSNLVLLCVSCHEKIHKGNLKL